MTRREAIEKLNYLMVSGVCDSTWYVADNATDSMIENTANYFKKQVTWKKDQLQYTLDSLNEIINYIE